MANLAATRIRITMAACCSIALATWAAVAMVPNDVSEEGALFWPALCLTVGLFVPICLKLRLDLTSVLRIENIIMIGVVYWLLFDLLQSAYPFPFVAPEDVRAAFGVIGAFAAALWFGASGRGWSLPVWIKTTAKSELNLSAMYSAMLIAFILGMADFTISSDFDPGVMLRGLGEGRFDSPWARGALGGTSAFLDHTQYFGYILPSLCVLIAIRAGWLNWRVITGLLLSAIFIVFVSQGGGRRIAGVIIGAALFTWVSSRRRLSLSLIFCGSAIVVILIISMQEMLRYRDVGFDAWWAGDSPAQVTDYIHVDDNMLRLVQLISFYPNIEPYVLYHPLVHALTLPVPRAWWPGKPTGPGFDLPALLGLKGVALSSSILGELYVSYGIWAVIAGGWFLGRMAGMWNKLLHLPTGTGRSLMYGLGVMVLFAGLRSMQSLVQMSYIVLAWVVLTNLVLQFRQTGTVGAPPLTR